MLGKSNAWQVPSIPSVSFSSSISEKDLEEAVSRGITKAGVEVSDKDIAYCHRVGRGPAIIKFCKRTISKQVSSVRKHMNKLTMGDLQLTGHNKLCNDQSLCLYYRILFSKSKSPQRMDYFLMKCSMVP